MGGFALVRLTFTIKIRITYKTKVSCTPNARQISLTFGGAVFILRLRLGDVGIVKIYSMEYLTGQTV